MPPEKRRGNVFGEEEPAGGDVKRLKSGNPAAPSFVPTSTPANLSVEIAKKRAEVQAKLQAMKNKTEPKPEPKSDVKPASKPPPKPSSGLDASQMARNVAEAKRLVERMQAQKLAAQASAKSSNPYLSEATRLAAKKAEAASLDPLVAGRGGLSMLAHPLLMDTAPVAAQIKKARYAPMAPKFATAKANASVSRPAPVVRPVMIEKPAEPEEDITKSEFYDPRLVHTQSKGGKGREGATLKFNQKGKFIRQAEAMRAEAKMEELKQKIIESARKTGLAKELEDQTKSVKRPPPPDVEWWDTPFLPEKGTYDDFSTEFLESSGLITHYVQHPIQIPGPLEKKEIQQQELHLTKKEIKKKRRIRRKQELEDRQDRIKMGLLPPDPPKVKLSNMMRVLTQEAVADPTKIEAKVRREMEARRNKHERTNEANKLTDEQRRAKITVKHEKDEAKGIFALCFKIKYLIHPSHKFKVFKNAQQHDLTGLTLFNPKFTLVLVEGGAKAIKAYRKLMLDRIDWTDDSFEQELTEPDQKPVNMAENYCKLIWEGQHREKLFRYFKKQNCPAPAIAKELLGPKCEGLWDLARVEEE